MNTRNRTMTISCASTYYRREGSLLLEGEMGFLKSFERNRDRWSFVPNNGIRKKKVRERVELYTYMCV